MALPLRRTAVVILTASVLAGCGFQLRGAASLSPALNPLLIETVRGGSALLPPLRAALEAGGAEFARDPAAANARLVILADAFGQRVVAVTPQGQPREAELSYTVEYELHDAEARLLQRRALTQRIEFAINERDLLGKTHEAEVLNAALVDRMVVDIMRNLATVHAGTSPN